MTCILCNSETNKIVSGPNDESICLPCYNKVCSFCNPIRYLEDCEGHSVSRTPGNRFMHDKDFVNGMRFEFESDRKLINGPKKG